jgi:hypothetical protein
MREGSSPASSRGRSVSGCANTFGTIPRTGASVRANTSGAAEASGRAKTSGSAPASDVPLRGGRLSVTANLFGKAALCRRATSQRRSGFKLRENPKQSATRPARPAGTPLATSLAWDGLLSRDETEVTQVAEGSDSPSSSRALVPLAPSTRCSYAQRRTPRHATFLAHLIATARQVPQTRERRRAEPAEAIAAYQAAARLRA